MNPTSQDTSGLCGLTPTMGVPTRPSTRHVFKAERKARTKEKPALERRLTFASPEAVVVGYTFNRAFLDESLRNEYWWPKREKRLFRSEAKKELNDTRRDYVDLDVGVFESAFECALELSQISDDNKEYSLLCSPRNYTADLERWSCIHYQYRGLERWITPAQRINRNADAKQWRSDVINMSLARIGAEEIAKIYRDSSRAERIFARFVGRADQVSARTTIDENDQNADPQTDGVHRVATSRRGAKSHCAQANLNVEHTPSRFGAGRSHSYDSVRLSV